MSYSTVPLASAQGLGRRVADLMHPGVFSVPAGLPLAATARAMADRRVHALLVFDEHGEPVGWVTTHGLLHNLPRDWETATAGDAVSDPVTRIGPDAEAGDAIQLLLAHGVSHALVCAEHGGPVLGVLADFDLLAAMAPGATGAGA